MTKLTNEQTKIKPYVSMIGRDWIVLDCNSEIRLQTRNKEEAFAFWRTHFDSLNK